MKRIKQIFAFLSDLVWTNKFAQVALSILFYPGILLVLVLVFKFKACFLSPEVSARLDGLVIEKLLKRTALEDLGERDSAQPATSNSYSRFVFELKICPPRDFRLPEHSEFDYVRLDGESVGACEIKKYQMTAMAPQRYTPLSDPTALLAPPRRAVIPGREQAIFARIKECALEIDYPSGCEGPADICPGKHSVPLRAQVVARALFAGAEYGGIKNQREVSRRANSPVMNCDDI